MTTTASVRAATGADAGDIARIGNQLGYEMGTAETADRIRRILMKEDQRIFIAEADGRPVGWVHVAMTDYIEADPFAIIAGLVVDRNHRRQGLARRLMEQAERWAIERGSLVMRLNSSTTRTGAHEFYEKIGYERIKTQYSFARALGAARQEDLRKFVPKVDA
jgi:GNAT superfamily N-acetyltransferase